MRFEFHPIIHPEISPKHFNFHPSASACFFSNFKICTASDAMFTFVTKSFLGHSASKNNRNFLPVAGIYWPIKLPVLSLDTIFKFPRKLSQMLTWLIKLPVLPLIDSQLQNPLKILPRMLTFTTKSFLSQSTSKYH